MRMNKNLLSVTAGIVSCVVLVWLSTSIWGGEKTYELHPQVGVPEYRSDAARAIDAYERLMERYMDLTEGNLIRVGADVQSVIRKLDSIDGKLAQLSTRIARIEGALGLKQPTLPTEEKLQPDVAEKNPQEKSSPPK
jgi:hypothetical protein